jgi:hypothetical protein
MFCIHSLRGLVTVPAPAVHPDTVVGTAALPAAHAAELRAFHTVHGVFPRLLATAVARTIT